MREQRIALKCYHDDCAEDEPLEIIVKLPDDQLSSGETKEKLVYCERNHANIITIPNTWDEQPLVLGDDQVIGRKGDVPIVQGRRP